MVARSNTLSNMRYESASTIFDLPAEYFTNNADSVPRDTVPELQRLLGYSINEEEVPVYQRIPPVLCLNEDPSKVYHYFLNPCLFRVRYIIALMIRYILIILILSLQVARTALFGKSATKNLSRAVSRSASQYLRTDTASETTFGLICWTCVVVRVL